MTNGESKKYHKKQQKIRKEAIEKLLPIVVTLTKRDWSRISSMIDYYYGCVAAQVVLDDDSLKSLERSLKCELNLETYRGKPIE